MKILFVDLNFESVSATTEKTLRTRGHITFHVHTYHDALNTISNYDVDAVVFSHDSLEVLDFVAKAHAIREELPLFVADDWSATELPLALEWCQEFRKSTVPLYT